MGTFFLNKHDIMLSLEAIRRSYGTCSNIKLNIRRQSQRLSFFGYKRENKLKRWEIVWKTINLQSYFQVNSAVRNLHIIGRIKIEKEKD